MYLTLSSTIPFRNYRRRVGRATFYINTAVIGLELVAAGGEKPTSLNIHWDAPKQRRQSVDQAKSFILVAVLNLAFDAFDAYLRELSKLPWLPVSDATRDLISKAATGANRHAYSERERANGLAESLGLEARELLLILELSAQWRNTLIHSSDWEARLGKDVEHELRALEDHFADKYALISVSTMLDHYRNQKTPTLKEATTLVAATQNLVRAIDESIVSRATGTMGAVEAIGMMILRRALLTTADGVSPLSMMWGKDISTRTRKIWAILERNGMTPTVNATPASLSADFVEHLASLTREEASASLSD